MIASNLRTRLHSRSKDSSSQSALLAYILHSLLHILSIVALCPKTSRFSASAFNININFKNFKHRLQLNFPVIMKNNIRLQSGPDACLKDISTVEDIRAKVEEVRKVQCEYRDATLYKRHWNPVQYQHQKCNTSAAAPVQHASDEEFATAINLKVLQFNTLAEGLSAGPIAAPFEKSKDYKENAIKSTYGGFTDIPNPEIVLDFNLRRWRLMEILLEDDFDIIAMEEVDRFYGFFAPLLKMMGYAGLFVPKPLSPGALSGWYSDGCALFWKKDQFQLIKEEKGAYSCSSQVYSVATLKHNYTGKVLIVAATHLKAGKGVIKEEIRAGQVREFLDIIQESAKNVTKKEKIDIDEVPIIAMGDFNSDPEEENSCVQNIISNQSTYRLQSAYMIDSPDSSFTTWKTRGTSTFKRTIDYIFYNADFARGIECSHTLSIPTEDEMEDTRLPGFKYPSDHIAIGAKFKIHE